MKKVKVCPECGSEMREEYRLDQFNDCEYILYICPRCGHTARKLAL